MFIASFGGGLLPVVSWRTRGAFLLFLTKPLLTVLCVVRLWSEQGHFYCLNLEIERYGVPHHLANDRDGLSSFYRLIVDLRVEGRVLRVWDKLHAIL